MNGKKYGENECPFAHCQCERDFAFTASQLFDARKGLSVHYHTLLHANVLIFHIVADRSDGRKFVGLKNVAIVRWRYWIGHRFRGAPLDANANKSSEIGSFTFTHSHANPATYVRVCVCAGNAVRYCWCQPNDVHRAQSFIFQCVCRGPAVHEQLH